MLPGNYQVKETNLDGYGDVSEFDDDITAPLDEDAETADENNDNRLSVNLVAGEADGGNNFVDELARITGRVLVDDNDDDEGDRGLNGVTVELLDNDNNVLQTTTTEADGSYQFVNLLPGDYQVRETNLTGYGDVSDSDGDNPNVTKYFSDPR